MRIGVIGLGHVGMPIAVYLHSKQHQILSWTRTEKHVPWRNSINLDSKVLGSVDYLIVASGGARPGLGNEYLELSTTLDLFSSIDIAQNVKIIYISSGAIYGECKRPFSEADIENPSTSYGMAKLITEQALEAAFDRQVTSLRVGNLIDHLHPYGILDYLTKVISKKTITMYGEPTDCRDYMGISDFLRAVESLLMLQELPRNLNVGSGKSIELGEIAKILNNLSSNRIEISWHERRVGDLAQTRLNVSMMTALLNLIPANPVELLEKYISEKKLFHHLGN